MTNTYDLHHFGTSEYSCPCRLRTKHLKQKTPLRRQSITASWICLQQVVNLLSSCCHVSYLFLAWFLVGGMQYNLPDVLCVVCKGPNSLRHLGSSERCTCLKLEKVHHRRWTWKCCKMYYTLCFTKTTLFSILLISLLLLNMSFLLRLFTWENMQSYTVICIIFLAEDISFRFWIVA